MKKIAYLRTTSIINDSRAIKEIETYNEHGIHVYAFGWNRQELNVNDSSKDNKIKYVMYETKSNYGDGIKNIFKLLKFELWLYRNLKKMVNEFDIIHACDFDTAYIGYKIAKKYNKRFIYDIYDYYVDCHNLYFLKNFVEKKDIKIINNADAVILCTEQRRKQIEKANPKNVFIIHNTPNIIQKENNNVFDMNKVKVCYVGILQDDRLIKEICDEIIKYKNIELHIGGFGKYEEYIRNLSFNYSNIYFYGQMKYSDVLELENKCDILFATYNSDVPNHKYSAPNKVYEAMCLGKPIIVCKNTGVDRLVNDEKIGYIIDYNTNDFFECINKITYNDYIEISRRGKELYNKKYKWDIMKEKMKEIIDCIEVK